MYTRNSCLYANSIIKSKLNLKLSYGIDSPVDVFSKFSVEAKFFRRKGWNVSMWIELCLVYFRTIFGYVFLCT